LTLPLFLRALFSHLQLILQQCLVKALKTFWFLGAKVLVLCSEDNMYFFVKHFSTFSLKILR
jgi:hypothetical protein